MMFHFPISGFILRRARRIRCLSGVIVTEATVILGFLYVTRPHAEEVQTNLSRSSPSGTLNLRGAAHLEQNCVSRGNGRTSELAQDLQAITENRSRAKADELQTSLSSPSHRLETRDGCCTNPARKVITECPCTSSDHTGATISRAFFTPNADPAEMMRWDIQLQSAEANSAKPPSASILRVPTIWSG